MDVQSVRVVSIEFCLMVSGKEGASGAMISKGFLLTPARGNLDYKTDLV